MIKKWNIKDLDACYRQTVTSFEDGFAHAAKQGIPRFIEEYRISRVKDAIAVWVVGEVVGNRLSVNSGEERSDEENNQNSENKNDFVLNDFVNNDVPITDNRLPITDYQPLLLDLGCGHGWYAFRLIDKWGFHGQIVGVDISKHNISIFQSEIEKQEYSNKLSANVANAEELPFLDNSFDLVYATESIEHVENPLKLFEEAYRVLKPEGEFIITTPSGPLHRFWNRVFWLPKQVKMVFKILGVRHQALEVEVISEQLSVNSEEGRVQNGEEIGEEGERKGDEHPTSNIEHRTSNEVEISVDGEEGDASGGACTTKENGEDISIYDHPLSFKEIKNCYTKAGFELIHYHKAVFLPHESYIRFFSRPFQYLMLIKAKFFELLGPLTMFWGLHHIIRLKK
jgi:SAM-dependent methyltransferase